MPDSPIETEAQDHRVRCSVCVCLQRERARLGLAAATFVWKHGAAVTHMLEWQQYQPVPLNTIQKISFPAHLCGYLLQM